MRNILLRITEKLPFYPTTPQIMVYDEMTIQHVVLYFSRAAGNEDEVEVAHLRFSEENATEPVGGGATTMDGVISTRRGNAPNWAPIIGQAPFGKWELALPNTQEMKARFKNEEFEDILFVLTYSGQTPEWPP